MHKCDTDAAGSPICLRSARRSSLAGALGWACWKTYLGRPEADWERNAAMTQLGNGLSEADRHEDRLAILEVQLATQQRLGSSEEQILVTRSNLSVGLFNLGRLEESVAIQREVYAREKKLFGPTHWKTLNSGNGIVCALFKQGHYAAAKTLSRKLIPQCRRALGPEDDVTLLLRCNFAEVLYSDAGASRADILEAVTILEDVARARRRVLGAHHPDTASALTDLERARMKYEDVAAPP